MRFVFCGTVVYVCLRVKRISGIKRLKVGTGSFIDEVPFRSDVWECLTQEYIHRFNDHNHSC